MGYGSSDGGRAAGAPDERGVYIARLEEGGRGNIGVGVMVDS